MKYSDFGFQEEIDGVISHRNNRILIKPGFKGLFRTFHNLFRSAILLFCVPTFLLLCRLEYEIFIMTLLHLPHIFRHL
jgi:hypothetical protein